MSGRRYYRVTCKHGHFGNGRYQPISFVFIAKDSITAMDMAKAMPGVRHSDMAWSCREIPYIEYLEGRKGSAYERMWANE